MTLIIVGDLIKLALTIAAGITDAIVVKIADLIIILFI